MTPPLLEHPPPVIDSARVLAYADVQALPYIEVSQVCVDGKLLERAPRFVITANLADEKLLLFYCDEQWGSLGAACDFDSVDDARKYVETRYPGVQWVDANVSLEEALAYYDAMEPAFKCGFCGKRAFQVDQMVEGPSATICGECIKAFHEDLTKQDRSG